MIDLPFFQVDAFAARPFEGNPAAVMPLIDSRPPATQMSIRSTMICLAAAAMLISPLEDWRSIVVPATVTGRPARSAAVRPIVACTPC